MACSKPFGRFRNSTRHNDRFNFLSFYVGELANWSHADPEKLSHLVTNGKPISDGLKTLSYKAPTGKGSLAVDISDSVKIVINKCTPRSSSRIDPKEYTTNRFFAMVSIWYMQHPDRIAELRNPLAHFIGLRAEHGIYYAMYAGGLDFLFPFDKLRYSVLKGLQNLRMDPKGMPRKDVSEDGQTFMLALKRAASARPSDTDFKEYVYENQDAILREYERLTPTLKPAGQRFITERAMTAWSTLGRLLNPAAPVSASQVVMQGATGGGGVMFDAYGNLLDERGEIIVPAIKF